MSKIRGAIYAVTIIGLLAFLWAQRRKHDSAVTAQIKSVALPVNDQAKVIVDPEHHTITVVKRGAGNKVDTTTTFLPSRGASIDLRKDGSVLVTAPKWGTEINPFVGGAFGSDIRLRAALGLNLLYVQRWELGGGLLLNTNIHDTRVFVHVSYNVYANYYVAGGVDNQRTFHLMAGLKF